MSKCRKLTFFFVKLLFELNDELCLQLLIQIQEIQHYFSSLNHDHVCRATQVKELSGDLVSVVLVGNKCDLEDARSVSAERASAVAEQLGYPYVETSAKDGTNIKEAFELLTDLICQRMADITDDTLPPGVDARQALRQNSTAENSTCMC